MISWLELSGNSVNAASILLAARNSAHTWWTGIVGCSLFALLFYRSQLYADVVLQGFFVVTSVYGWWAWRNAGNRAALPIRCATRIILWGSIAAAIVVAALYGYLLHRFTDAYAPYADSSVLTLSVVAQLLLMTRRYETWWFWIGVNTMSVALFSTRGLWVTAALYCAFWINAWVGLTRWRKLMLAH